MYTNTIADVGVLTDAAARWHLCLRRSRLAWHDPEGCRPHRCPDARCVAARTDPGEWASRPRCGSGARSAVLAHCSDRPRLGDYRRAEHAHLPGTGLPSSTSLGFLADLEKDMAADPPAAADGPVVRAMAAAGIGAGRTPGAASSGSAAAYLKALGLGARPPGRTADGGSSTALSTGCTRAPCVGSYGTDYLQRALWRRSRSVRRFRPKPSTSLPAAPGWATSPLRWWELAAMRSGSQPATFRPMDPTASGRSRSTTPQGSLWPTRSTATQSETTRPASYEVHDGSLTIVVSASRPIETEVNWLPAPNGVPSACRFACTTPREQVLDGSWSPPPIRRIG